MKKNIKYENIQSLSKWFNVSIQDMKRNIKQRENNRKCAREEKEKNKKQLNVENNSQV